MIGAAGPGQVIWRIFHWKGGPLCGMEGGGAAENWGF